MRSAKLLFGTDAVDAVVKKAAVARAGLDRCRNQRQHRRARAVNGRDERGLALNRYQRSVRLSSETLRECGHLGPVPEADDSPFAAGNLCSVIRGRGNLAPL